MLNTIKQLIAIRHKYKELHGNGELIFNFKDGKLPFCYRRGRLAMFFNPMGVSAEIITGYSGKKIFELGETKRENGRVIMRPQSFVVLELDNKQSSN